MTFQEIYFTIQNSDFSEKLAEFQTNALDFEQEYIRSKKPEIVRLRQRFPSIYIQGFVAWLVINRNKSIIFEIRRYFEPKGNLLKWLIEPEDLIAEFKKINDKGILIQKPLLFLSIKSFLAVKVSVSFNDYYLRSLNVKKKSIDKRTDDYLKREKYRQSHPNAKMSIHDIYNGHTLALFPNNSKQFNLKMVSNLSKGKAEGYFLKDLLDSCFYYNKAKMSQNRFYAVIYDLFRIILLDFNLENYDDFVNKDIAEVNYDRYKAKRIRKLLSLTTSK